MPTKKQYVEQARAANPWPQFFEINGERIQLTQEQYENSLESWAEMRLAQDAHLSQIEERNAAREAARNKLAALGLTPEEIAAFLG